MAEPVEGVNATPYADNPRYFNVAIAGPIDSPYEGMSFIQSEYLLSRVSPSPSNVLLISHLAYLHILFFESLLKLYT